MSRLVAVLALALLSVGCAEVGRRAVAPASEYAAYRRYRVADGLDTRLSAGYDYLVHHPRGRWRQEVRRWFDPAQQAYVEAAWDDARALRHFLEVVPDGEASRRAADRLVELELTLAWRAEKDAEFEDWIASLDARLEAARKGRRRLVKEVVAWTRLVSGVRQWGQRTHHLDHELIHAFRLTEPEGRCVGGRCVKPLSVSYAIPEEKAQSDRVALVDVVIDLEQGGVRRVTLTGPELFTRLGEAVLLRPILPTDLRGRTEALTRVVELVRSVIEPTLPESRCDAQPVSPTLLRRSCEGTELRLIAATGPGEEDRLVVEAATTPAAARRPAPPVP